ncbi:hypothetical protein Nepgr_030930 [Nepenthes gracilis]|uniref:Uncharacterized protein n=1 Tax=Nepenthes gracilis TaxID=150966 RepID=A0AAD3THX8_NEPGR|nr:hypothetical protein Nepgr_030930 [Nepenthes gracilis]
MYLDPNTPSSASINNLVLGPLNGTLHNAPTALSAILVGQVLGLFNHSSASSPQPLAFCTMRLQLNQPFMPYNKLTSATCAKDLGLFNHSLASSSHPIHSPCSNHTYGCINSITSVI